MFSANSNPPGGPSAGRSALPSSTQLAMDNLIRRELRVGDPNDPAQVAKGLLDRYQHDNRARAIRQEAQGLPFLQTASAFNPQPAERTATSIDLDQAERDVHKDLEELTTSSLLKDVSPELQGWSDAIRSAIGEGTSAARMGLDPRSRDRAFGIRRLLGDYARLSRLVGALTPSVNAQYRSLAQSLDEVASVILVMVGESMANAGFAGGRYLLQAPYSELQTRRDAVMSALQNLNASLQFTQNEWPRGIDAYRKLFDALEAQGQGDLRALMTEHELARVMDSLVRRAAHGNPDGLRALGSTAQIDLQRVYRLINFGYRLVNPESPPLTSFLESLRLFADGFGAAGGFRLLRVARPPVLFYGLYSAEEELPADRRLLQLAIRRGRLASQLDCWMRCECSEHAVLCQILLDKVLYDVDRSIDLYAVGQHDLGLPEIRAAAYAYVVEQVRNSTCLLPQPGGLGHPQRFEIADTLQILDGLLRPTAALPHFGDWGSDAQLNFDNYRLGNTPVTVGGQEFRFTELLHQELCLQRESEQRWEQQVQQMAPNCIPPDTVFGPSGVLMSMIDLAMEGIMHNVPANTVDTDCGLQGPSIPADIETSLDTIAYNHGRAGQGRP